MKQKPTGSERNKVVMTKLSRDDFARLQAHCKLRNESINSVLKKLVLAELDDPIPQMIAGKNIFLYNKHKDNFSWRIALDSGLMAHLEDDLPAETAVQLYEALKEALDERDTHIRKKKDESVPVPSTLVRKGL